jgi:tellurite methyltransferase
LTARAAPSPHLLAHLDALREAAGLGPVVDLACGRGRHALVAAEAGIPVVAIDRNETFLRELQAAARTGSLPVAPVRADLETRHGLPLARDSCGAILVFRYLFRPIAGEIAGALRPGGLLLYETFTIHQKELGQGPSNPAFLLREGELASLFAGLDVQESWEGWSPEPQPAALARLVARRPASA